MDIFTEIKASLRLHALREFTTEELLTEIKRRGQMSEIKKALDKHAKKKGVEGQEKA
ncbi:MAG: hypothetical protein OXU51_01090 [Candidatus Poribacteria bacterium]|nr:hypothetical protein [Candidatus Poribacteria bacterium]